MMMMIHDICMQLSGLGSIPHREGGEDASCAQGRRPTWETGGNLGWEGQVPLVLKSEKWHRTSQPDPTHLCGMYSVHLSSSS